MNKGEFVSHIANQQNITKIEAEKIINIFTESIISVLGEGNDLILVGFGKFYATKVEARKGRNPSTGMPLQIPAYIQPRFTAGEKLKTACNKNSHEGKHKPIKATNDNKKSSTKKG